MTEAPDYKTLVERKNAVSLFNAYIEVFELMVDMDKSLFKQAVRCLKERQDFKLDLNEMKRLKDLFPDLVPNVFTRLWK